MEQSWFETAALVASGTPIGTQLWWPVSGEGAVRWFLLNGDRMKH